LENPPALCCLNLNRRGFRGTASRDLSTVKNLLIARRALTSF
jgi:hypothetical protein